MSGLLRSHHARPYTEFLAVPEPSARSERNRRGPLHRRRPVRRGRADQRSAAAGRALPLGLSVVESAELPPAEDPPDAEATTRPGGELGHPFGAGACPRRRRTAGPGLPPLVGRPAASPSHPAARGESAMRAALYARVSTERQERQQTIDSQLAWVADHGHALADEHVFRDEG